MLGEFCQLMLANKRKKNSYTIMSRGENLKRKIVWSIILLKIYFNLGV